MATVGCAGKDKNDAGLNTLDPRVKAALTTQDSTKPAIAKSPTTSDPNATGLGNVNLKDAYNRRTPFQQPAEMPANTASLQKPMLGVPTLPSSGGNLTPGKPLEVAGPLPAPKMDLLPVAATVPEPLHNPTPTDVPTPPKSIVVEPVLIVPAPPPAPVTTPSTPIPELLPITPTDPAALPKIPSPIEKPIEGLLPIAPPAIK